MKTFIRSRPLALFITAAYLAAVIVFAIPLLSESGIGVLSFELPGIAPFIIVATFGLLGAAVLAAGLTGGRPAITELRRLIFRFRVAPGWYVLALTLLPLTGLFSAAVAVGIEPVRRLLFQPNLLLVAVIFEAAFAFLLVNWWEEAAWTGFVVDRLQPLIGPMRTSIVTTWLQAGIHLPLVFIADGVTDGRVQTDQIPFYLTALFLLPIPVRVIITWLYNTTGKSVPVVGLFHAGLGVATGSAFLPVIAPDFNQVWVYAGFAVVAGTIVILTRGQLGYHQASSPDHPRSSTRRASRPKTRPSLRPSRHV